MKTKKKSVDRAWFDLFDVEGMDHSISRIRDAIAGLKPGQGFDEAKTIRALLIDPIDAYLDEHWRPKGTATNVQIAERFREELKHLSEALVDPSPVREIDPDLCVLSLRPLWLEFIAVHAAPLVWHVPLQVQLQMSKIAKKPRVAIDLTIDVIAAFVNANQGAQKKTVIAALRERQAFFDLAAKWSNPAVEQALTKLGLAHGATPLTSSLGGLLEMIKQIEAQAASISECAIKQLAAKQVLEQLKELHTQLSNENGKRPISKRQLSDRLRAAEDKGLIVKSRKS